MGRRTRSRVEFRACRAGSAPLSAQNVGGLRREIYQRVTMVTVAVAALRHRGVQSPGSRGVVASFSSSSSSLRRILGWSTTESSRRGWDRRRRRCSPEGYRALEGQKRRRRARGIHAEHDDKSAEIILAGNQRRPISMPNADMQSRWKCCCSTAEDKRSIFTRKKCKHLICQVSCVSENVSLRETGNRQDRPTETIL